MACGTAAGVPECQTRPMDESSDRALLVAKWWEYYRLAAGSREQHKTMESGLPPDVRMAHDHVAEIVERGAPEVVELLADLAVATPAEQDPALVGTGPLEDLIRDHGDAFGAEIELYAGRVPEFAAALRSIRLDDGAVSAASLRRLSRWLRPGDRPQ